MPTHWYKASDYFLDEGDPPTIKPLVPPPGVEPGPERFELTSVLPELLLVDLEDPNSILGFVRAFGPLGQGWGRLGTTVEHIDRGEDAWFLWSLPEEVEDFRRSALNLRRAQAVAEELFHPDGPNLHRLRAIPSGIGTSYAEDDRRITLAEARDEIELILGQGLRAFHLRFLIGRRAAAATIALETSLSLYSVVCLEIALAAASGLAWRRCALSGCSASFVPRRPDQIFHDNSCARAQANRDWRRREKAKREKTKKAATKPRGV